MIVTIAAIVSSGAVFVMLPGVARTARKSFVQMIALNAESAMKVFANVWTDGQARIAPLPSAPIIALVTEYVMRLVENVFVIVDMVDPTVPVLVVPTIAREMVSVMTEFVFAKVVGLDLIVHNKANHAPIIAPAMEIV